VSRNDVILGVAALVLVAFSLAVSIVIPRRHPGFPGRSLGVFTLVAITLVVVVLATVEIFGDEHEAERAEEGGESVTTETAGGQGDAAAGLAVFAANCGRCHRLEEAGTSGTTGPNLDASTQNLESVARQVMNGGGGMPSFVGWLSAEEIQNVAAFVVASRGFDR
jgi:cytochrome c6